MNNFPEYRSELTPQDTKELASLLSLTMSQLRTHELTEEDFQKRKDAAAEFRGLVGDSYNQFSEKIGVDRIKIRAYFYGYLEPLEMAPITEILREYSTRHK